LWLNEFEADTNQNAFQHKANIVSGLQTLITKSIPFTSSELALETEPLDEKTFTLPPVPEPPVFMEESIDQDGINDEVIDQELTPPYEENQWAEDSSTAPSQYKLKRTVTLQEHRRMRSRELHYLDHPLFGVLVLITPYELPEPEEVEVPIDEPEADSLEDLLKTVP